MRLTAHSSLQPIWYLWSAPISRNKNIWTSHFEIELVLRRHFAIYKDSNGIFPTNFIFILLTTTTTTKRYNAKKIVRLSLQQKQAAERTLVRMNAWMMYSRCLWSKRRMLQKTFSSIDRIIEKAWCMILMHCFYQVWFLPSQLVLSFKLFLPC